ncbi:right-handed parallel beta-helix repeat-containing protein [Jiangella endophytica]|uniref:right-handed parallel beta-helix repeat-containing protein n=1 Tax=Jiangella endophytica TaxID=1623398 RepID=UPI000E357311|nr:right-handed parallel beta-helix repeat-containing protein [Jiangella endophytica]
MINRRSFLAGVGAAAVTVATPAGGSASVSGRSPRGMWQSSIVSRSGGTLAYVRDSEGNRVPDFSRAGYRSGPAEPAHVPAAITVQPVAGDNAAHLQAAIDSVGALPVGPDGFRGAVQLAPGVYELAGTLRLRHSGVVLRGSGDGDDPAENTILRAVGVDPARGVVVMVGKGPGAEWKDVLSGSRIDITSDLVQVAEDTFTLASAGSLVPGSQIIVEHPCTQAWLDAIGGGGTATDAPWSVGLLPIRFHRYVEDLDGTTVRLDAPVFNHLDRSLSQCSVYQLADPSVVREVGVENLRVDVEIYTDPDVNGAHAKVAIRLHGAENAWVRDCTMVHFGFAGVETIEATRSTIERCRALDPASAITGGDRYNFNVARNSQLILFRDCHARAGRHSYVSNGTSTVSGIVFQRCVSEGSLNASQPHRQWSQGMLYDQHREVDPVFSVTLTLHNRGDFGTGHGWTTAHSVAWNCDVAGTTLVVQKPPTAQNYAIGCQGNVTGVGSFVQPAGWIEGVNQPGLCPESLYAAQTAAAARSRGAGRRPFA